MFGYDICMEKKNFEECDRSIFTLSQAIPYQIKIAGRPNENWANWNNDMDIQVDIDLDGLATTTLTGLVDQAALIGLLRQLYTMGFPIISVNCIPPGRKDKE